MTELKEQYVKEYCNCCGRENITIWNELKKQPVIPQPGTIGQSYQEWEGHKVYKDNDFFYEKYGPIEFCTKCGGKLADEDFHTTFESRGECHGAPCSEEVLIGVKCSHCGFAEKF